METNRRPARFCMRWAVFGKRALPDQMHAMQLVFSLLAERRQCNSFALSLAEERATQLLSFLLARQGAHIATRLRAATYLLLARRKAQSATYLFTRTCLLLARRGAHNATHLRRAMQLVFSLLAKRHLMQLISMMPAKMHAMHLFSCQVAGTNQMQLVPPPCPPRCRPCNLSPALPQGQTQFLDPPLLSEMQTIERVSCLLAENASPPRRTKENPCRRHLSSSASKQ